MEMTGELPHDIFLVSLHPFYSEDAGQTAGEHIWHPGEQNDGMRRDLTRIPPHI
jgi:hypothetical protein